MAKVLLFNIEDGKGIKIKNLCRKLYIETQEVDKAQFGCQMGYLLGMSDDATVQQDADFDDEMLYLVDIDGGMLNLLLSQLRKNKATVALKAVKTDTNLGFTAFELHREISAEREALANGIKAHGE